MNALSKMGAPIFESAFMTFVNNIRRNEHKGHKKRHEK